jgi:putative transcriptional regulator
MALGPEDIMPRMDDGPILKNRVRELRVARNLRQADLAHQVQVTRQTILAIEKDRLNPSIRLSLKIAQVLGEAVDNIFYLVEQAPGAEPAQRGNLN